MVPLRAHPNGIQLYQALLLLSLPSLVLPWQRRCKGSASHLGCRLLPRPSIGHVLEGVDAGDDPPALPVRVSRETKAEESIEPVRALAPAQHGVPIIASTLPEEQTIGPSAALIEETPDDVRPTKDQVGSSAEAMAKWRCPIRKSWNPRLYRARRFHSCIRALRCLPFAMLRLRQS
ncbi:hypothetical protein Nepgr_028925 [Nepenthes gracilis]|uniref:Secreted protein n=1 Tax=Nepenthes gracilis TaxID=150966 RepID=A0AAD3TCZ3_NEPGR|nr:hypothetical protein Nepgr_028925 [Nepenthes gracilis]